MLFPYPIALTIGGKKYCLHTIFLYSKKIAKQIFESEPELVVCTYRFIHPICIQLIKKALPRIKVVHVNPDAITTFEYQQIFATPYDVYFTKDPFIVNFMKNKIMNLNAFYLPEALNTRIHKMPIKDRYEREEAINIDVVAFGTMYPYRANMVGQLIGSGVNVSLFGTPEKRYKNIDIESHFRNEYITGERKAEVLFGSKIIFNNFHYAEVESANVKFFEIAGIGGFQICDYKPVLEEYTAIPLESFTYNSIGEAIDLIKYYLDKPLLRHQLALKQHDHFILNHTYEHRINKMLALI